MNLNFLNIINPSETEFKTIANKLFNEFAIQTYDSTYRIIEMEFYWNSVSHKDESTYHRKYVDPKSGEWFFHYSGVDIALKNETTGGYGGILLRGVYDITHDKLYKGPMVCAMRLFSGTSAFETAIQTKIVQHTFPNVTVNMGPRIGLGKNAKKNDADKLPYRFFITHIK